MEGHHDASTSHQWVELCSTVYNHLQKLRDVQGLCTAVDASLSAKSTKPLRIALLSKEPNQCAEHVLTALHSVDNAADDRIVALLCLARCAIQDDPVPIFDPVAMQLTQAVWNEYRAEEEALHSARGDFDTSYSTDVSALFRLKHAAAALKQDENPDVLEENPDAAASKQEEVP